MKKRARVAARSEGGVHHRFSGRRAKSIQNRVEKHRNVTGRSANGEILGPAVTRHHSGASCDAPLGTRICDKRRRASALWASNWEGSQS